MSVTAFSLYPCRRFFTLLTLAVAAVLLAHEVHAQRSGFRFPIYLPSLPGPTATSISCASVLVRASPDNYPHCYCEFGSWSSYKFRSYERTSTCPSGYKYVLESTRTRLSTKCTQQPATQRRTKDVCKCVYMHMRL